MIKTKLLLSFFIIGFTSTAQIEVHNEDFQSGLPAMYTIIDNDGLTPNANVSDFGAAWHALQDPDNSSDTIMGSTSYFEPVGTADRWLITSSITLGAYGNFLYWEAKSHDPSFPDDYFVMVSRTDTQLSSFTDTIVVIINELESWQMRSADLSEFGLDNETIHVAFVNRTIDGFKLYIDDIRVEKEDPVGINELSKLNVLVYPNPSSNLIYISGIENINNVKIYSSIGKLMLESQEKTIDISKINNGHYTVVVETENDLVRTVLIKQ